MFSTLARANCIASNNKNMIKWLSLPSTWLMSLLGGEGFFPFDHSKKKKATLAGWIYNPGTFPTADIIFQAEGTILFLKRILLPPRT